MVLLLFAAAVATSAFAAVTFAQEGKVTFSVVIGYGLGFLVLWGFAHLAVRHFAPAADPLLLPLVVVLNGLGLVMIFRLNNYAEPPDKTAAVRQLVWTALAVIVFMLVLALIRDHTVLARYAYTAGLLGLIGLVLPAAPIIGAEINGARLWLQIGPFSFQPAEISKILLMIFFAGYLEKTSGYLEKKQDGEEGEGGGGSKKVAATRHSARGVAGLPGQTGMIPRQLVRRIRRLRPRDLGPVVVAWLASLGVLVIQHDLGSSMLFFGMFIVILYVTTGRATWVVLGMSLFLAGAYIAYQLFGHVQRRVDGWLHAFDGDHPYNQSFQLVQSLFSFAAGGVTGTGLGAGNPPKNFFAIDSDFIFAPIGEELGLAGVMAVLTIYFLIVMRGMSAAVRVRDSFGKLLATGMAATLALQVFVQIGGVMRLIPLTGLTLPFVSAGGSSIVANAAIIALLLRISDAGRRQEDKARRAPLFDPSAVADVHTQVVKTT
jgi:cell division protein FtsW (lipid II flippase)